MSDEVDAAEEEIDLGDDPVPYKKKLSGKKIVLFFVLPMLLLGGGVAGVFFSGVSGGDVKEQKVVSSESGPVAASGTVFFELPEMLVNLNTTGRRPNFLKMAVSLELANETDALRVKEFSPRIIDNFQIYLRELRVEDLRGSAGMYRLREELLARVNTAIRPIKVKDVLFRDMLVQ